MVRVNNFLFPTIKWRLLFNIRRTPRVISKIRMCIKIVTMRTMFIVYFHFTKYLHYLHPIINKILLQGCSKIIISCDEICTWIHRKINRELCNKYSNYKLSSLPTSRKDSFSDPSQLWPCQVSYFHGNTLSNIEDAFASK